MRRRLGEIGEIDLVHRLPIGAVGDIDGAFHDIVEAAAGFFEQGLDIVDALLGLGPGIADGELAVLVGADAADEHEAACDRRLGEGQAAFVDAVRGDDALGHGRLRRWRPILETGRRESNAIVGKR
ncbi:MAG: hypothetical protein J0I42_12635 [Bosea sp.]|nr:hypothetical protein [Bosea sp. (in: a-proteobacteria)]MBN9452787.1 hypothetical protein [Bosea sp. (in: a-proteobacteria)]